MLQDRLGIFGNKELVAEGEKIGIYRWWKQNATLDHPAFIEHVVKPVALVKPHAANTERSNSMHKLLIGDKRAVVKNERAFKMLYVYQNGRAMEAAQSHSASGSWSLPKLSLISRVVDGGPEILDNGEEFVIVEDDGEPPLTEADEEVMTAMEEAPIIRDDHREVLSDDDASDVDDIHVSWEHSSDNEEGVDGIREEVTPRTKRRARTLAAEIDCLSDCESPEAIVVRRTGEPTARASLRKSSGSNRGRGCVGRGASHSSARPLAGNARDSLTALERERETLMQQNAARLAEVMHGAGQDQPTFGNAHMGGTMEFLPNFPQQPQAQAPQPLAYHAPVSQAVLQHVALQDLFSRLSQGAP